MKKWSTSAASASFGSQRWQRRSKSSRPTTQRLLASAVRQRCLPRTDSQDRRALPFLFPCAVGCGPERPTGGLPPPFAGRCARGGRLPARLGSFDAPTPSSGSPVQNRCRRCRAAPGVAGGSGGGPLRGGHACRGRTAVPPHCLCRLSPCPVGFVQNPSSACPTIRPQSETKHYGVFGG